MVFRPSPAARMLYHGQYGSGPPTGAVGHVTTVPVPGGKRTCMPGPRGGLIYADWEGYGVEGVFALDLEQSRRR